MIENEKQERQFSAVMMHKIMKVSTYMRPENPVYKNLSCQYITEALFRLMDREDYREITISQITAEARLARRTFYINFSSKDDILDQHYASLIREYDRDMPEAAKDDLGNQAVYFFTFWKKHREYAVLLEKNRMLNMLIERFHLYLDDTPLPAGISPAEQAYGSSFLAGGLFMMLRTWLQNGFRESPGQLADIFLKVSGIGKLA